MPNEGSKKAMDITELPKDELLRLVGIFLGDVLVHYGMWFTETLHTLGSEEALKREREVLNAYAPLALNRLAPHFGIELEDGIPRALLEKSREDLLLLIADIAKTWVTSDGLWFQAVESVSGMDTAKAVNDSCWSHFAQMEAYKIRMHLGIGVREGLPALEKALKLRIYATINAHESSWDEDGSLLFRMTECRVQSARRRKQMDDYPCKSAGIVEYSNFTRAIDPRIETECVWCPPDRVPDEQFCMWRFRMKEGL
jgi:hypothetical protein